MTSIIANLWNRFCTRQVPLSIMIIGLDNSGKTCLLNSIRDSITTNTNSTPTTTSTRRQLKRQTPSREKPQRQACDVRHQNVSTSSPNEQNSNKLDPDDDDDDDDDDPLVGRLELDGSLDLSEVKSATLAGYTNATLNDNSNTRPTLGYNWERLHYKGRPLNVLDFSGQSRYRGLWQEFYNCVDAIIFVIDSSDLIRLVVVRDELENTLNHPYFSTLTQQRTNSNQNSTTMEQSQQQQQQQLTRKQLSSDLVQKQLIISQGKLIQSPLDDQMTSGGSSSAASQLVRQSPRAHQRQRRRRRSQVPILFLANKTDLSTSVDTDMVAKALNLSQLHTSRHPWIIRATSVNTGQGVGEALDWLLGQLLTSTAAPTTTTTTTTTTLKS